MLTSVRHSVDATAATTTGAFGCYAQVYPGADTQDASGLFRDAYPEATFRKIMARAYVASRTLDYVLTGKGIAAITAVSAVATAVQLPRVDASRVSITGHSRNGKQSLVAAAFDERITSVVGSSPGTPVVRA